MIPLATSVSAYSMAAYLHYADVIDSSTPYTAKEATVVEQAIERTYAGSSLWRLTISPRTVASDNALILVGEDQPEDAVVAQLNGYRSLLPGWDGERAAAPLANSIESAIAFARIAPDIAARLEPTLHDDGTVILETSDNVEGSIRFLADGTLVYAINGKADVLKFDGLTVSDDLLSALRS